MSKQPLTLTDLQRAVLCLASEDFGDKVIAGILQLSVPGVRAHWKAIFEKLGVHSRGGAIGRYYQFRYVGKDRALAHTDRE